MRQAILYDTICSVIKCQQEHKSRIDENAVLDLILYRKEKKNQEFMYYGEIWNGNIEEKLAKCMLECNMVWTYYQKINKSFNYNSWSYGG